MPLFLALVSLTTACVADGADEEELGETEGEVWVNPATDSTEPAFMNGRLCKMVFPGALTPETDVYAIWALGRDGIVDTTYNTRRPNVFAVFVPVAASLTHHVAGYDQYDHYHVLDNVRDNRKWDLLTLWPGPNFDVATYRPAKSVPELMAQSAAGILSPVRTLPEIGFAPLVMYSPINCY
jgi:hypothetical protein